MARAAFGIGDEFSFVFGRDIPKHLRHRPRAITVENHQAEIAFFQFPMNANQRFGGRSLHKRARLGVNRRAGKIVGSGVSNIEFYSFVEFGKFYQISLAFVRLRRRRGLGKLRRCR